jgi:hypothetical protein
VRWTRRSPVKVTGGCGYAWSGLFNLGRDPERIWVMNKIIDCGKVDRKKASEIPEGQAFRGTIGGYTKHTIFMKGFSKVMCLETGTTWDNDCSVTNYIPVDLEIKVIGC